MIRDDGTVINFNNPKVQASLAANTFAITGQAEVKSLTEMLPGQYSPMSFLIGGNFYFIFCDFDEAYSGLVYFKSFIDKFVKYRH